MADTFSAPAEVFASAVWRSLMAEWRSEDHGVLVPPPLCSWSTRCCSDTVWVVNRPELILLPVKAMTSHCTCINTLCKFRNVFLYLYRYSLQWIGFPVQYDPPLSLSVLTLYQRINWINSGLVATYQQQAPWRGASDSGCSAADRGSWLGVGMD